NSDGVETVSEFFNWQTARKICDTYEQGKAVIANNVLAHVDEVVNFLQGCRELLTTDGLVIIEVPYLQELLHRLEFDTIYHEHLCYFSVTALLRLCKIVKLSIIRIERKPVHGGSLRI
ncbi:MAG: methyltransferase domain-containing protein, partial [Nitrosopumilaceae archaeon]|nr:class I SAM-dependent methyltransferase [Nitrosopumilaceae archaeon]NIX63003.1 methyltransferase domain-containing protein [Nitrosopumilaceae archaeon]